MSDCGCGSCSYTVRVQEQGGVVDIATDLHRAPSRVVTGALTALALHLGAGDAVADMADVTKGKADDDPRFPVLEKLIAQARRDWWTYGQALVDAVLALLRRGPLTPETAKTLEELFRAHEAAVVLKFAGVGTSELRARAIANGFLKPGEVVWPHTDIAYRAGIGQRMLEAAAAAPEDVAKRARVESVVEMFANQPLTARDEAALHFARERAALRMRKPLQAAHDAIRETLLPHMPPPTVYASSSGAAPLPPGAPGAGTVPSAGEPGASEAARRGRELTDEEYARIRPTVERAVLERRTSKQLESDLRQAVVGTPLTNDMERVARTELREAHAQGAYVDLKTRAEEVGIADPEVMKITSATGCVQCIRIWGRGGAKRYRLSQVEAWEAQGGNFGKPANEWGPTIGPVHPNCTCGPLLFFDPGTHAAALATAAKIVRANRPENAP